MIKNFPLSKKQKCFSLLSKTFLTLIFCSSQIKSQGTWTPLTNLSPDLNCGVMLLLSDGTVMAKTLTGAGDTVGNVWNKLTPDINGSYINGTWSALAPMNDTRLYFSSQILKDGRVFVAGGEYGTGGNKAEVYDPLTDSWTMTPIPSVYFGDANSSVLPDGKVLVGSLSSPGTSTKIYNPVNNNWATGGTTLGGHDEAAWLKLKDSSILFVDIGSTNSERYIPSTNNWVADATVPVDLYDFFGYECGASLLLPDGRAFFLGSTGHTAYYTPSGNTSPGTWAVGPDFPNGQGTPDAAAAMMVNGKILCATSPIPDSADHFPPPTSFYEFDYLTNSFLQVTGPWGTGDTISESCYNTNMLDLPDGNVLYADQYSYQYYVYTPGGSPIAAGKPTISNFIQLGCDSFRLFGTLFNGLGEGAAYGDDWQMATNYPIVRLTSGANVYYARTSRWNSTGVQRGNLPDSTLFVLPAGLPFTTFSMVVVANGNASNPVLLTHTPCDVGVDQVGGEENKLFVYPNPAGETITLSSNEKTVGKNYFVYDVTGKILLTGKIYSNQQQINLENFSSGFYFVNVQGNLPLKFIKK